MGGVLIWIPLDRRTGESRSNRSEVESAAKIANAHTIFNTINAFLVIGFIPIFARLVERLVKDRPEDIEQLVTARYLDRELLRTPTLALDRARLELLRMADRVRVMLGEILPRRVDRGPLDPPGIEAQDDEVDALQGHIIGYLGQISQTRLTGRAPGSSST